MFIYLFILNYFILFYFSLFNVYYLFVYSFIFLFFLLFTEKKSLTFRADDSRELPLLIFRRSEKNIKIK